MEIPNPGARNTGRKAWNKLKKDRPDLYNQFHPNRTDYDWHHNLDGSLELVDKELHSAYQHTGLNSVLKNACMAFIPGLAALSAGRFSDAGREIAVEVSPLGWGQWITSYFDFLYEWAKEGVRDDNPVPWIDRH